MPGGGVKRECAVRRGPGELFDAFAKVRAHGVLVNVVPMRLVARVVVHAQFFEAVFPDGHFGFPVRRPGARRRALYFFCGLTQKAKVPPT
jgi:hypothetical protein